MDFNTSHTRFLKILVLSLILYFGSYGLVSAQALTNVEQQLNIINGEFSTASTSFTPTDNGLGLVNFDSTNYSGDSIYFEVVIRCDTCSGGNAQVSAQLYNDAGVAQGSALTTTNSTNTRLRSGSLALPADDYTVRFRLDADSGTAYLKAARLIVDQNIDPITDTQTQIEIGHYETSTNTSANELTDPKIHQYNHNQYDGTINAYFEATMRTSGNDTNSTYYFDARDGTEEWTTTPGSLIDGNNSTYASTSTDGDIQLLTGNTGSATDLGEINTVEVRAHGYQTDGSDGLIRLRPVFGGSSDGDNHNYTLPENVGNAAFSSYIDITTDTNAPSTWSWSDIENLDLDVEFVQGASGTNTAFVSQVEIRVLYEDNSKVAYVQLYNVTDAAVVQQISTSNNDYVRVRSGALSTNWDTTNSDEYQVRIYTSHVDNTAYISNAKIIIDQTAVGGLSETEVVHHYVTTERSQTNTVYTQDSFINQYQPTNFQYTNDLKAYYEAVIRTTGSTGYSALYDDTAADLIDTTTVSEVTTTSAIYDRVRSSNIAYNDDWPSIASNMTPVLKASTSETTYVSESKLIISAKAIDPSFTFTITEVAASQTINGITTTNASTISTLPFGNVSLLSPEYVAHQLGVVTNEAVVGYTIYTSLQSTFQGIYPANEIDPFVGGGATWNSPQTWSSPTGTTTNVNTGWFGANITDTDITGWSGDTTNKFGPIDSTPVEIMSSTDIAVNDTEYVVYGLEVNVSQPADTYSGIIIYNALPTY